mmetsp:Transcript_29719/g.55586  ORF Transcript_29719/g.55586 Transcript_29719/m.55586 type:complete len:173 (-) Transcript_29719:335-853(-)
MLPHYRSIASKLGTDTYAALRRRWRGAAAAAHALCCALAAYMRLQAATISWLGGVLETALKVKFSRCDGGGGDALFDDRGYGPVHSQRGCYSDRNSGMFIARRLHYFWDVNLNMSAVGEKIRGYDHTLCTLGYAGFHRIWDGGCSNLHMRHLNNFAVGYTLVKLCEIEEHFV